MKRSRQWIALLFLSVQACVLNADEPSNTIQQPARFFGYTIGDVLEQRISLQHQFRDAQFHNQIPLERIDEWIERLSANLVDDGQWLEVRYQIINSPTELVVAYLPALEIPLVNENVLNIKRWAFSIAPLIPAKSEQTVELAQAQADWQPTTPDALSAERNFNRLAAALLGTLLVWLLWWLWQNRSDAVHLPFARAYKKLRKLDNQSLNETQDAWVLMHHAFNQTAGRTVSTGSVEEFVHEYRWLKHLNPCIQDFYKESARRFFAESEQTNPFDILQLSKTLFLAEKLSVSGLKPNRYKVWKS